MGIVKKNILVYRENPSEENTIILLTNSERIWNEANSTVLISQIVTERKLTNYQIIYIFFGINLILTVLIVYLIKKYVQGSLEFLVQKDEMTKLYNRRYFDECLKGELSRLERYSGKLSLIIFDIDFFKDVNDNFGHNAGDSVLKELASLINVNLRKSDILCRIGGEEFAILLPATDIDSAFILAEKIRVIVEKYQFDLVEKVSISLGITQYVPR